MTIPPFIVFACIVGVLLLIGGLIHTVYRLGLRVQRLEIQLSGVVDEMAEATAGVIADEFDRRGLIE